MKPNSLQDLYTEQLMDLYDAEQQIIKALPEIIDNATSQLLKDALTGHLQVTREQATRLEQIFSGLGQKAKRKKCKGMEGVLKEGSELIDEIKNEDVRDAAIIASAQRVEHYEMAGYGTARAFAQLLGDDQAGELLQRTLDEEKEADQKLTELAEDINTDALQGKSMESEAETSGASKRKRKIAA
jgi:ferritin-like metal-binding protein YciE